MQLNLSDTQVSALKTVIDSYYSDLREEIYHTDDYDGRQALKALEHELELIRSLPAHSRCFLIRHANHSVVVRLDLSGMPELLMILSGREASVRRLDAIRQSVGDNPVHWYPLLTRAGWPPRYGLNQAWNSRLRRWASATANASGS